MSLFEGLFGKPDLNDFEMTETMWGYVAEGATSFKDGYEIGKQKGNKLQYVVTAHVDNFKQFKAPSGRRARMTGWVTCQNLYGEKLPIRNGEYGLYTIDRETGQRRITYKFNFTGKDGKEYFFSGYKVIVHEPWRFDILEDQTTLFATITRTDDGNETVAARGIIHYHVEDFPEMLLSIRTPKNDTIVNRVRMATKFFAFVTKELSEYIREINPFYKADYTNFICRGVSQADGENVEFFFFSGAHDKGFPWGDEMGLRSDHSVGRSFARRGQTPVIPGTGQRFGCNMISAITNRGRLNFMVFKENFQATVFLEFLKRLIRQSQTKAFLIVDGHRAHRAKKVNTWLDNNTEKIRLFFLPSYSPELNPDEILNQDVKSNAVGRQRAHNLKSLLKNMRSYLRGRQRLPHIVKKYFQEKHVRYAAA